MKEMYFTIAGCNHYYGSDFMEKGMKVKLVKEPDNEYDSEAIQVKIKGLGKVGYVANSPYTVKGESMSAGRLYDKIGGKAKGKIVFVTDGGVISSEWPRTECLAVLGNLFHNRNQYDQITERAQAYSQNKFNAKKIREEFYERLSSMTEG